MRKSSKQLYSKLFSFLFLACLIFSFACKKPPAKGLIAYYPFNGNTVDQTSNHYNAVAHNGVALTTDRKGKANRAYYFDGVDDYISIPHDSAFNFSGKDLTITLWTQISATQNPANSGIDDIVRKWNGDTAGYPFSISFLDQNAGEENRNKILLARYDGSVCLNGVKVFSQPVSDASFYATFHHIVYMKRGSKIILFLDGVKVSEVTDTTTCATINTADVTIGRRGNAVRNFTGKIDDIRFYNRALTDAEVATLFRF